jgi:hypothetical protein
VRNARRPAGTFPGPPRPRRTDPNAPRPRSFLEVQAGRVDDGYKLLAQSLQIKRRIGDGTTRLDKPATCNRSRSPPTRGSRSPSKGRVASPAEDR